MMSRKQGRNKIAKLVIPLPPNLQEAGDAQDDDHYTCDIRDIPETHRHLVLVLGMPKCGTTSLHYAFESAGFRSVHWALDAGIDLQSDRRLREWGEGASQRLICELMRCAAKAGRPPLADLPQVDAIAEMNGLYWRHKRRHWAEGYFPQMSLLETLLHCYPDAHYVLNIRDHDKWLKSVDLHNDMRQRLVCAELPGLPSGCGQLDEELVMWVEAHHQRVMSLLAGARLLVFDIERDGSLELSNFFGRRMEWDCHNATRY